MFSVVVSASWVARVAVSLPFLYPVILRGREFISMAAPLYFDVQLSRLWTVPPRPPQFRLSMSLEGCQHHCCPPSLRGIREIARRSYVGAHFVVISPGLAM
jgi:hypothetical protein